MSNGVFRAASPMHDDGIPRGRTADAGASLDWADMAEPNEPPPASTAERVLLGALGLAAFVWIAVMVGMALSMIGRQPIDAATLVRGVSLASGPLALIVTLLILWQRNTSRTAQRYADVARMVRMETLALDAVLGLASRRLAEDRAAVAEQADRMVMLADDTSARMRIVTDSLQRGIDELARQTEGLDVAAGSARVDLGVLLSDLPRAETHTRQLAEALRAAGLGVHEQSAALEQALAAIVARARETEEQTGGVANRLTAQATQVATVSDLATRNIEDARQRMSDSIDGVLERAGEAVEQTRRGIGAQTGAIDAMVEHADVAAAAAVERTRQGIAAQDEAIAALAGRARVAAEAAVESVRQGVVRQDEAVDALGRRATASALAAVEQASQAIAGHDQAVAAMAERARLAAEAASSAAAQAVQTQVTLLSQEVERLALRLGSQDSIGAALVDRIQRGLAQVEARFAELDETGRTRIDRLVEALGMLGGHAERTLGALNSGGTAATTLINRAETLRAAITVCLDELGGTLPAALERLEGGASRSLEAIGTASPEVERLHTAALAAAEALEGARAALEERRTALERAVGNAVEGQIARLTAASDLAIEATRAAGEKLEDQLGRIADTSARVEGEIAAGRASVEDADRDNFSRQVSVLIEALNTTAVDVSKLLSTDPTDEAWAAYLKGDRGAFTRRAVRIIENGDAREIGRLYAQQPHFRDQVNRYITDFERLLRPILATRDGSTLAVVMLSSNMGKLYVALAQGIERIRS